MNNAPGEVENEDKKERKMKGEEFGLGGPPQNRPYMVCLLRRL